MLLLRSLNSGFPFLRYAYLIFVHFGTPPYYLEVKVKVKGSATARQGPHVTLKKQQMGWGTRLATVGSGEVGYESRRHAM